MCIFKSLNGSSEKCYFEIRLSSSQQAIHTLGAIPSPCVHSYHQNIMIRFTGSSNIKQFESRKYSTSGRSIDMTVQQVNSDRDNLLLSIILNIDYRIFKVYSQVVAIILELFIITQVITAEPGQEGCQKYCSDRLISSINFICGALNNGEKDIFPSTKLCY